MRVIGVIDLLAGQAVHASGGVRDRYQPLHAIAGRVLGADNAVALAQAFLDDFELDEIYVADLDAIMNRPPQDSTVASIAALGAPVWLDAAVTSGDGARRVLPLGVERVIVGLETLPSRDSLAEICGGIGGASVAFSCDLRNGEPVTTPGLREQWAAEPIESIVTWAAEAGATAIVVIDLGRVGTSAGLDFGLLARIRSAVPDVTLLAGGGVRNSEDLVRLAECGCDGALVATALHQGRISASELAALKAVGRQRVTR